MKKDSKKILRMYSGLLNPVETEELKIKTENSSEIKKLEAELKSELSEMKEVYQSYPDQNYFNNLSRIIINQAEAAKIHKYQPSFAYAFAIAVVIFITSQLFDFNSTNITNDYSDLINAADLEEYLSLYQSSELSDFSEMIDTEIDLDYTAYMLNNTQSTGSFQSSVENEIIDMLDDNTAEKIYNEIISKKIL